MSGSLRRLITFTGVGSAAALASLVVGLRLVLFGNKVELRRERSQMRIGLEHATDQLCSLGRRHSGDLERVNVHIDLDRVGHSTELQLENFQSAAPGVGVA